jgi:hypothetical protein
MVPNKAAMQQLLQRSYFQEDSFPGAVLKSSRGLESRESKPRAASLCCTAVRALITPLAQELLAMQEEMTQDGRTLGSPVMGCLWVLMHQHWLLSSSNDYCSGNAATAQMTCHPSGATNLRLKVFMNRSN